MSKDGVEVDPEKVACIETWEFPRNVTDLRRFLGLTGYYRQYCENYATKAASLTEILRLDVPIVPTEERLRLLQSSNVCLLPHQFWLCQLMMPHII